MSRSAAFEGGRALRNWMAPLYRRQGMLEYDPESPQMVIGEDIGRPISRTEHFSDALKKVRQSVNFVARNNDDRVVAETAMSAIARSGATPEQYRRLTIHPRQQARSWYRPNNDRTVGGANHREGGNMVLGYGPEVGWTRWNTRIRPGGRATEVSPPLLSPEEQISTTTLHELGHHSDTSSVRPQRRVVNRVEGKGRLGRLLSKGSTRAATKLGTARGTWEATADQFMLDNWRPGPGERPSAATTHRDQGYQRSFSSGKVRVSNSMTKAIAMAATGETNPDITQMRRSAAFYNGIQAASRAYLTRHPVQPKPSSVPAGQQAIPGLSGPL